MSKLLDRIFNKVNDSKRKDYLSPDEVFWINKPLDSHPFLPMMSDPTVDADYASNIYFKYYGNCPNILLYTALKTPFQGIRTFILDFLTKYPEFELLEQNVNELSFVNQKRRIMVDFGERSTKVDGLHNSYCRIYAYPVLDNREYVTLVWKYLDSFRVEEEESDIDFNMVASTNRGFEAQPVKMTPLTIPEDDFTLTYGKTYPKDILEKFIKEDVKENLMIIHGPPGTGKTNLIKLLLQKSEDKIIYVPPSMVSELANPAFVKFMLSVKDSILILEDAEAILSKDRNQATNNLLNLTDGFLKDALNLKIICTFNCDLKQVDKALLRKGRLYFEYEVDKLPVEDAQRLCDYLKNGHTVKEPMTLTDIYNLDKVVSLTNSFEERKVGFV